jgi:hypothetical protein
LARSVPLDELVERCLDYRTQRSGAVMAAANPCDAGNGAERSGRYGDATEATRRRMPASGLTIAWRRTRGLDDWVAYIAKTKSTKLILAFYRWKNPARR